MSTMPATHGHSAACCNIPPVVATDYQVKGSYEELGGLKTYVTGHSDATKGIVVIYDIFGYFPQTLQGSDILATSDDHSKYKVFIPDWLGDNTVPIDWFPPDNEDKQKKLGDWFSKNGPPVTAEKVPDYVKAVAAKNPSIKSWGIVGYCWGGKVACLTTSAETNPFSVAAICHPASLDASDAGKIKIPFAVLASKDEDASTVADFEKSLKVPKHVETFGDQIHGWMAARSNLKDARVKDEYTRGYKTLLEFFASNWK